MPMSNRFNTTFTLRTLMSNQARDRADDSDIAELRDEYPSGLRVLMQNESVGYMIDALMDMPGTHFNKSLLAEKAGVSRQSVHTHIPLLTNLGIVRAVEESDPVEYTLNDDDEIVRLLHRLDGVVNRRLNRKTEE
jgi:DNA-binding transcriptional ArsR family regulator